MLKIREKLLADIDQYLAATGIKPSTFGRLAVHDPKLVGRLRAAREINTGTADKAYQYMHDNPAPSSDHSPADRSQEPPT